MKLDIREWSPPAGLVIQPGSLLVPGRVGWVPRTNSSVHGVPSCFHIGRDRPTLCRAIKAAARPRHPSVVLTDVLAVSVARWDLSGLTESELDSLQVAIEAQRQRGIGEPCPATEADRLALGQITR